MSSELEPRKAGAPAASDSDNRYKSVQAKLGQLARAMDDATVELGVLRSDMRTNAKRVQDLASRIDDADLDPKYVDMTSEVSTALGGAAVQSRKLHQTAEEVSALAYDTRHNHAQLYEGLDTIRSGRRDRTPKPGFFVR
ncbi:conjugal transfer protein TraB [Streptomyces rimosus]|uniref:hypothetical protein n=1 Tax=Streptomyces rimosus TaxID=1927 RepID=UPI0004C72F97|nr:hypothetical protein [Streptomyces rimosus]